PKGSWRWIGTHALVFDPQPALSRATGYKVSVPAGTKALDGSSLGNEYAFEFATPAPKLVRLEPSAHSPHLVPTQAFELRFNQPVDLKEAEEKIALKVGLKGVRMRASWPKPDTKAFVKLVPQTRLPLASDVTLR